MKDEEKPSRRDPTIWEALGIASDLLATVLITATVFALLGVFADKWFGTKYVFKIVAFILMFVVGYRIIVMKGKAVAKRLTDRAAATKKDHPT